MKHEVGLANEHATHIPSTASPITHTMGLIVSQQTMKVDTALGKSLFIRLEQEEASYLQTHSC